MKRYTTIQMVANMDMGLGAIAAQHIKHTFFFLSLFFSCPLFFKKIMGLFVVPSRSMIIGHHTIRFLKKTFSHFFCKKKVCWVGDSSPHN